MHIRRDQATKHLDEIRNTIPFLHISSNPGPWELSCNPRSRWTSRNVSTLFSVPLARESRLLPVPLVLFRGGRNATLT